MKFINKMRKKTKGFTLVEIIVVLVILAILAAFTIPTMLGFVSDAKSKAMIAEVREVYVAAQSTATEYSVTTTDQAQLDSTEVSLEVTATTTDATKQMKKYIGEDITLAGTDAAIWTVEITTPGKVDSVTYTRDEHKLKLADGKVEVIS